MDVELRHLRYFVAVAKELHFGRAAASLHMAQPPLSQQIQRLEYLLDTQLLVRTSRSVALTAAGGTLYERARALLAQAGRDFEEVSRIGRGEQGRLDVGFVSSALALGPIESVRRFRDFYPLVQVQLHEGFTSALLTRVRRGELDVATVRDPGEHAGVMLTHLLSEPLVAVLPADHPLSREQVVAGAQLANNPFVLYPPSAGEHAHRLNLRPLTDAGHRPNIAQEASSWATIMHLVGAGMGVSIAPTSATLAPPETVRIVPLARTTVQTSLYLATRVEENRPVVKRFLDVSAQLGGQPRDARPTGHA